MVEDVHLILASGLLTIVAHGDDVFEGVISLIVVESKHVDPPLYFNVLSRFVSHSNDVLALSSYIWIWVFLSICLFLVTSLYLHPIHPHHRYLI